MNQNSKETVDLKQLLMKHLCSLEENDKQEESIYFMGAPVDRDFLKKLYNTLLGQLEGQVDTEVTTETFSYQSVDSTTTKETTLTGLLIYPEPEPKYPPVISYQHGTIFERKYAPSRYNSIAPIGHFSEVVLMKTLASLGGYIVVMPDYQGLGADETPDPNTPSKLESQPYVVAKPNALATADALLYVKKKYHSFWSDDLLLMGYSEGGFVTMAAAREIQENPKYNELNVSAIAPMAGPYSLSVAMRKIMTEENPYVCPAFLPLTIRGFYSFYGKDFDNGILTREAFKPEYQEAWDYCDGYHSIKEINSRMPELPENPGYGIPRDALSERMLEELQNPNSPVYKLLKENDTFRNWTPTAPMYLYHGPRDTMVPYPNAIVAHDAFAVKNRIVPEVPMFTEPFNPPVPPDRVHSAAALPCMLGAVSLFEKIRLFGKRHFL